MTERDAQARFTDWYAAHRAQVYAYAVSRAGRQYADDVVSETFLIAWRRLDAVPADPLPWLLGVARNVVRDRYRDEVRRLATGSAIGVPRSGATQVAAQFTYRIQTPNGPIGGGQSGRTFDDVRTGQLGGTTPVPGFHSSVDGLWAQVGADGDASGSPNTYSVSHHEAGRMISGYRRQVAPAELATIETRTVSGEDPALTGGWYAVNRVPGEPGTGQVVLMGAAFPLPATRTHYVNTDGGLQWRAVGRMFWTDPANGDQWSWWGVLGPWTGYQAGRTYRETWGAAVAGPVLPGPEDWGMGAARGGDVVAVRLSPYGDGAGRPGREIGEGTTLLYRDGVKVGESRVAGQGEFTVPAAPATPLRPAASSRCR
ncbi:RNA polymerase sigma factor [Micromonospora sp. NPDC049559]|uniref:RNA polymerase sigma factor n=1 Tax=Micromonospora sp. NPDC049559 TaxID=3155923 RepID=UPI003417E436